MSLRQTIRNFLLTATLEELEKERRLSLERNDSFRAAVIEEMIHEVEMETKYNYYVGTLSRCAIIPNVANAREALEKAEEHPLLKGSQILTVRVATPDEVELHS